MQPSSSNPRQPSTIGTLIYILWGPIAWGGQLTTVYVGHTWLCAFQAMTFANAMIAAATILALASIAPVLLVPRWAGSLAGLDPRRTDAAHLITISRWLAFLSALAALWTGATFLIVEACQLGR